MFKTKFVWFAFLTASILGVAQANAADTPRPARAKASAKTETAPAPPTGSKPVPAAEPSAEKMKDMQKHPEARRGKGHL